MYAYTHKICSSSAKCILLHLLSLLYSLQLLARSNIVSCTFAALCCYCCCIFIDQNHDAYSNMTMHFYVWIEMQPGRCRQHPAAMHHAAVAFSGQLHVWHCYVHHKAVTAAFQNCNCHTCYSQTLKFAPIAAFLSNIFFRFPLLPPLLPRCRSSLQCPHRLIPACLLPAWIVLPV